MAGSRGPTIQRELLLKSQEAALNAIQTFNNPLTTFKAETFIVLMNIAWMYLLHAYYRKLDIDYRYFKQGPTRRKFDRTKHGGFRYWELDQCLNVDACPLDQPTKQNLRFLIGLRHEIEHHKSAGPTIVSRVGIWRAASTMSDIFASCSATSIPLETMQLSHFISGT